LWVAIRQWPAKVIQPLIAEPERKKADPTAAFIPL
jgi:hypothetical protein